MANEIAAFETQAAARDRASDMESRFLPVMSISTAVNRYKQIQEIISQLMEEDEDYGLVPGSKKKSLFKPGAQKLCNIFGLTPRYEETATIEDWNGSEHGEPLFYYRVRCSLYRGDFLIGEGEGSASSWEAKYRYRYKQRECPKCGKEAIIKGRAEYGGGWVCYMKLGGCGATYKESDPAIGQQRVGRVPNADIYDQVNTILKMASKRAYIAAVLDATGASRFFTQDLEDMGQPEPEPSSPPAAAPVAAGRQEGWNPEAREKMRKAFAQRKTNLGGEKYYAILGAHGFEHSHEIPTVDQAREIYEQMTEAWEAIWEREREQSR